MADFRALLVGIVGGIIAYYATKGIDRYLARRVIQSRQRQIKQLTLELRLLEKLGVTDRSLLLFAFRMLFVLMGFAAVGVAGAVAVPFLNAPADNLAPFILLLVSVLIAFLAFYSASMLRRLEDPEPTLAKLRQKLRELQDGDDQSRTR